MSVDRADIVLPAYSIGDSSRFRFPHTSVLREAEAAKSRLTSVTGVFCDVDGVGTGFFGQNCSRSQLTEGSTHSFLVNKPAFAVVDQRWTK